MTAALTASLLVAGAAGPGALGGDTIPGDSPLAEFSLGFRVGASFAQHVGTEERNSEYEVSSEWRTGVTAGFFIYWPVTRRFGLQQDVVYTRKGSRQSIGVEVLDIPTVLDVTYEMDYIELPVLLRFTWLKLQQSAFYSLAGSGMSLKINDRYSLKGELADSTQVVPITANDDMSEVDLFDFSFVYGFGYEARAGDRFLQLEYRFTMGWNTLYLPTYAYVPFGDEMIFIDNDPVPLKNQAHCITLGIRF